MDLKSLEVANLLKKVSDMLYKEDYYKNIEETIKVKNLLIKELLKVIVTDYCFIKLLNGDENYSLSEAEGLKSEINFISQNFTYYVGEHEDIANEIVELLYKDFVGSDK